jgi:hypothetical protein
VGAKGIGLLASGFGLKGSAVALDASAAALTWAAAVLAGGSIVGDLSGAGGGKGEKGIWGRHLKPLAKKLPFGIGFSYAAIDTAGAIVEELAGQENKVAPSPSKIGPTPQRLPAS